MKDVNTILRIILRSGLFNFLVVISFSILLLGSLQAQDISDSVYTAWVSHFYDSDSSASASDIAVGISGDVYVTGNSWNRSTGFDYVSMKYDSNGVQKWVTYYNGIVSSSDAATALTIDDFGNCYVVGSSVGSGTDFDYATVKYNSAGIEQWVARYNRADFNDWPIDIAVDQLGNVYVTGSSYSPDTDFDFITIKYNSNGIEQWIAQYNGLAGSTDIATGLAIDDWGNIYVTGWNYNSDPFFHTQYVTVKYNSQGTEQWVNYYNGGSDSTGDYKDEAVAIAVDDSGNVYVTGLSYDSAIINDEPDYATIKYNSQGIEQWVARYDTQGMFEDVPDVPVALCVDNNSAGNNVYVTGWSLSPNLYGDFLTVKYNLNGEQQWVDHYNWGNYQDEIATAIAVDDSGNTYVTGWEIGSDTYKDYLTLKYNGNGLLKWFISYDFGTNSDDEAIAIAIDNLGHIYVTGTSYSGSHIIISTIKYSQEPVNSVRDEYGNFPVEFWLAQNFPNPFNPTTTIKYQIPELSFVTLKVYDVLGSEIVALVNEEKPVGNYEISFEATALPSGIYFYRIQAGEFVETKKMVLLR